MGRKKANNEKPLILIVEKNEEDAQILSEIISLNYEPVFASTEEEVLSLLQDKEKIIFGAIFNSIKALEILPSVRCIPDLEDFPLLISLEEVNQSEEDELLELGVIDFLKKPFGVRRVLNRLKTVVRLSNANHIIYELERDDLTGLYTRQAFLRHAQKIREEGPKKKFCIMAFDIDNFKSSNTLYGEEKCNEFLAFIAKHLKSILPSGIAGRFGGDQFVLFFEYKSDNIDVERLQNIIKTILDAAPIPHQIVKAGIHAPISKNLPLVVCCDRAFLAIRDIKGLYGKDIAFFENKIQKQLLNEQRIIETMESSLKNKEFLIYYQPKHETITGKIVGAEALVRWNHKEYGFMSPGQFIPLFEKNGFITKLDLFVLEQVCQDLKRWCELGYPVVPISVNVSRHDFMEKGCIEKQIEIIDKYKINHALIHMEVTESLYSENTDIIISQVKKAQELGFMIEMDDFGAGYSSLGLLSSFPLNIIKLDISFVRNLKGNEVVIENIIKMAHRLGLLIVAEGAETNEQVTTLKTLGCDFIQGFYYSKPLPVLAFEDYLNKVSHLKKRIRIQELEGEDNLEGEDWHFSEDMLLAVNEVAEGIPGGFFSYHADGDQEIISFNRELMSMFACKDAKEFREYTGNSFKGIVFSDDYEYVQKSIESQINGHNDLDYVEYRIIAKDGTVKYVRDYGRFVKTKKYGDIFYVFLNDTTEEERWRINAQLNFVKEEELQRKANLAKTASHAKNIFISNVIIDILPTIKTLIECTDEISSKVEQKKSAKKEIEKIKNAEEYLLGYINKLREFVQIENGKLKLKEKALDISSATKKIFSLIEDYAKEKGVKVEYWDEIYHPYIFQDLIHTSDVVLNIVQNAIKYTPRGGCVKFCLKQLPTKNEDECIMEFICEDNGLGVSEEFMPYICRPFAREDNKINKKTPGAGLGLYISKALLVKMNGIIEIKSSLGKGTKVRTSQPHKLAKKEDVTEDTSLTNNLI